MLAILSTTSPAAAFEVDPGMRTRPDADSGPTRVSMELYVIDIAKIDDRDQVFKADISIRLRWLDPRLARPGESDVITLPLTDIWNPRLRIYNQRDVKTHFPEIVRVDAKGFVAYEQRYTGDFTAMADIRCFPFDERTIIISMLTVDHSPSDVILDYSETSIDRADEFSIPNWSVGDVEARTGIFRAFGGREFLSFDIELKSSRKSTYYIWSVVVPLVLIVMMSWSVFFVNPKRLESQLTLAATSMLTLVAYRFAVSSVLPPVPYMTRLDVFITGSTVFVFLALVEAVTTGALADNDHNVFAERLDSIARILFPAVFVIFVTITFLFW
jgi:hypothetical protein